MKIPASCESCLYNKQKKRSDDPVYLAEIQHLIDTRAKDDPSPLLAYRFNQVYERIYGPLPDYTEVKQKYNQLVLDLEDTLRSTIQSAEDPLATALLLARIGNYIDFSALSDVTPETFLSLLKKTEMSNDDARVYETFLYDCASAERFLLITDNCGEIALDKLFLEVLHDQFPQLQIRILVRGANVINDATMEDAHMVGIDQIGEVLTNGLPIPGTVYSELPPDAREAIDTSHVILAKGQGNYESLSGQGRHIYYAFLCKCDLFIQRFGVPPLTGMFVCE